MMRDTVPPSQEDSMLFRSLAAAFAAPLLLAQLCACSTDPAAADASAARTEQRAQAPQQCRTGTNICRRDPSDSMVSVSGDDWKNEPGRAVPVQAGTGNHH
jgi:hypothetical protein